MNKERSLKDIRILQIAFSALILVLAARFAILPALEKRQDMQQQYEAAEELLDQMQGYLDRTAENHLRLESAQKEFEELASSYYPLMETQEIDSLITGIALKHDLFPVSLSISPQTSGIPEAYLYSDAAESAVAAMADAQSQAEDETESEDTGEEAAEASLVENYGEMVKEVQVSFTISGGESDVWAMIDELEKEYPAIRLCSFRKSENVYMNQDMEPIREDQVNFVLAVTMYEG